MVKSSRGFPLQYNLLIGLAFQRSAAAKLSRGFPLKYHRFIALSFDRGVVARLSRHDEAHSLTVRRLDCVEAIKCHLSIVSPVLRHTEIAPPLDLHPETHMLEE